MASLLDFVMRQNPRMAGLLGSDDPQVRMMESIQQPSVARPAVSSVRAMNAPATPAPAPSTDRSTLESILSGIGTVFTGADDPNLTPEQNARIRAQALLMSGLGTLAAEGTGLQRFAQGAMVGQQAGAAGRERAEQEAMEDALMDAAPDVMRNMPEDQRGALTALLPGLPVAARQEVLAGLALRQRESILQTLSPGDVLINPATGEVVFRVPEDAGPELDSTQLGVLGMLGISGVTTQEELAALPNEQRMAFGIAWDQIRRSTADSPQFHFGERAEVEALVGINAGMFQKAQEAGMAALDQINTLSQVEALLADTRTGAEESATLGLRQLGAVFGLDQEQVSQQEALRAFENRFALSMRQLMGGGVLSDNDIKFLKESVIGLGKTPEANRLLAAAARRIAETQLAYQAEANRYVTQESLMGLAQHMARWASENRIKFDDLVAEATGSARFRRFGGN